MADNPRIDELRRRVDKDPASIAFAQLAEEYRRSGDPQEAVRVCLAGLAHHPNYVSARVTLGRSLMELQQFDEAQTEFEQVLLVAPDNLVAVRSMAELYQLKGETPPDMSLARETAPHIPSLPVLVTPPPIPDVPEPVVEIPPAPVLETPAPVPHLIAVAPDAPPPLPDLPLQVEEAEGFDADISLDLDMALAEPDAPADPEPPAPPEPAELAAPAAPPEPPAVPDPPGLDLDAAVAAFNEAFAVPEPVVQEPEPQAALQTQAEPEAVAFEAEPAQKDSLLADLEEWLAAIEGDRNERRIP